MDGTVATPGGLDVPVDTAGFQHIDPVRDPPEDTWDRMIHVMLTAPFLLSKYIVQLITVLFQHGPTAEIPY